MSRNRDWEVSCKVYIGNLGNNASKFEIEDAFSKFGDLKNVWVARNPPGFAFVEFSEERDAEDAVRAMDGTRVCGQRIKCEMSNGQSSSRGGGGRYGRGDGRRPPQRYSGGNSYGRRSRSRSRERMYRRRRSPSYRSMSRSLSRSPCGDGYRGQGRSRRSTSRSN